MDYISNTSSALILMIGSLACNCIVEEMQTDAGNACCTAVMNVHKRVTELATGSLCARNHFENSTEVLVFCINEVRFYWKHILVLKVLCSNNCYFRYRIAHNNLRRRLNMFMLNFLADYICKAF